MSHILTSIHGNRIGLDLFDRVIAPGGLRIGPDAAQTDVASGGVVALFEDFEGPTLNPRWAALLGSAPGTGFANVPGPSGICQAITGAGAAGTMAVNGVQLDSALNWQAGGTELVAECRVKLSTIATLSVFFGFTNQVAALAAPAIGSGVGNGVTFNANDAVGILYDTAMATSDFWLVGNKAAAPVTPQDSKTAPVAATYATLRVSIDKNGTARFSINGRNVGQLANAAISTGVNLSPVLTAFTRAAVAVTVAVDYFNISQTRI